MSIERGVLSSPHRVVLLAHGLGMLQQNACWYRLPLRLYQFSFERLKRELGLLEDTKRERSGYQGGNLDLKILFFIITVVFRLAKGGYGEEFAKVDWARYWKRVTYAADIFVVQQGLEAELIAYLEHIRPFDRVTPGILRSEPHVEERIEAIIKYVGQQTRVAQTP